MRLKSIAIFGFKSFPDKTKLEFGDGMTAVVGPNGSGKSNISDAVRWVLGEQSNKTLRGLKTADVIFNGTATRKAVGYAEVTLTIDNRDGGLRFENTDGNTDVSVTRRYYHSGESEYKINGAAVRLKDINELFMDTGLGRDGYSMIGQGKIDDIVSTKSSERRDIFEEASGIAKFRYRKTEAERRLAAAEDNLVRLRDIMAELESRVEPLKEQSEKAEKFIALAAERRSLEISLWLLTLDSARDVLRDQDYKITLLSTQYAESEQSTREMDDELEAIHESITGITLKTDEIRRMISEKQNESAACLSDIAVLKSSMIHNDETRERLLRDIAAVSDSGSGTAKMIEDIKAEIESKTTQMKLLEDELLEKSASLQNLFSSGAELSGDISRLNGELSALTAKSSDLRVESVTSKSSAAETLERIEQIKSQQGGSIVQLEKLTAEEAALSDDLGRAEDTISSVSNTIEGFELRMKSKNDKAAALKSEMDRFTLDIGEAERRAKILIEHEKSLDGYAEAVKSVLSAGKSGTLRGLHGPVSRIITVPAKYAAAIETALGFAMQHIVVDNEQDAKRAIEHLKTHRLGRATFLPLTAVKGNSLDEKGLPDCQGFLGIGSEIVTYDGKYGGVVRSLLGRVAIVDDIDGAIAISKKYNYRFRIVTLDGQVVNAGGSLTGGSLSKSAGLLSRGGEIEKQNAKAAALKKELETVSENHRKISEEVTAASGEILAAKSELTTAQEDKIRVSAVLNSIREQLKVSASSTESLKNELFLLTNKHAELTKRGEQSGIELDAVTLEIEKLQEKISELDAAGKSSGDERTALSDEISGIRIAVISYGKEIDGLKNQITQMESSMSQGDSTIMRLRTEMDDAVSKTEAANGQIALLEIKMSDIERDIADKNAEIEAMSAERDGLERKITGLRQSDRDNSSARERLTAEITRLTERKNSVQTEYNEIIRKLYDEYELTRSAAEEEKIEIEDKKAAEKTLSSVRNKIRALGNVNVSAIEEYKEVSERYIFMKAQIDDVEYSKAELNKLIRDLGGQMEEIFTEKFQIINKNFKKVFTALFGGGVADLELTDPSNVLETGIDIKVQLPGKNQAIIEQLSGGEKALIAISIYFAIMKVNPPPFCLLDEVDAALDEVNVDKFAEYLRRMTDDTQFIVITHRRGTMEEADILYGVTMQEKGVSKLLKLDVAEMEMHLMNNNR